MTRILLVALIMGATPCFAAESEVGVTFARSTRSQGADVARLTYRRAIPSGNWWKPDWLQFGASVWRVPDLEGRTRRFDLNLTPIWRADKPWGYVEAGIGAYLLSKTINNDVTRLPSSFQFGSHVGAGLRLGTDGRVSVGIGIQHLSNAGLKQPNGGIDLVTATVALAF
jgi:hypothetical protein